MEPPEPRPMMAMRAEAGGIAGQPEVPVQAGTISIRAMVTLTASIK